MKKLLAAFFTIAIVCVFSGILTVCAETNYYPEHDVNANGVTDVFDLIQMKNQLLNEKTIAAEVDTSDILWFKGNLFSAKDEIRAVWANENPAYTENLLINSRKIKGEGNCIVLLTDDGELVNLVFRSCFERTSDSEIMWYLHFDNIPYYICKDNTGELLYCRDYNKYDFSNSYNATQVKRFLEIVGEKDIETVDFDCGTVTFIDKYGRKTEFVFGKVTNDDSEPGYNTFEYSEQYLTVYEKDGKFAVNIIPKNSENVFDYSDAEANDETMCP